MIRFILNRFLYAIPLFLGVITVVFLLLELAPGDPVYALVGDYPVSQEYLDEVRRKYGLDQPLPVRYLAYLGNVLTGDLGYSFANRQPVLDLILDRLGNTLLLTLSALVFASVVAVVVGRIAGSTKNRFLDNSIVTGAVAAYSIPSFWLGQMLLVMFALNLGWFPISGMTDVRNPGEGLAAVGDVARHLALPALALATREIGTFTRMTRASVKEVIGRDYILTARSKGLGRSEIIHGHVTRNAMLPVVTMIGYSFGFALSGSVLIETVFGWPGMGRLLYQSIVSSDTAVVVGIVLFIATAVLVANLLTDIVYGLIDPRVRVAGR